MNRKERRELERKLKHIQKTKPWELQALIRNTYGRDVIDNRSNSDILAPGNKVMIDIEKLKADPEFEKMKPEFLEFAFANADKVFTLRKEAKQEGPFGLVTFEEDETDPRWAFYLGHVKKVGIN